jgi:hypothetical protein
MAINAILKKFMFVLLKLYLETERERRDNLAKKRILGIDAAGIFDAAPCAYDQASPKTSQTTTSFFIARPGLLDLFDLDSL